MPTFRKEKGLYYRHLKTTPVCSNDSKMCICHCLTKLNIHNSNNLAINRYFFTSKMVVYKIFQRKLLLLTYKVSTLSHRSVGVCPSQMRVLWIHRYPNNFCVQLFEALVLLVIGNQLGRTNKRTTLQTMLHYTPNKFFLVDLQIERVKHEHHIFSLVIGKWYVFEVFANNRCAFEIRSRQLDFGRE